MRAGGLEELRDGRAHGDAVRVARVDAAEQGLHEAVDDLAAEAGGDVLPHGDVVTDLGGRQLAVPFDAVQALCREDPGQGGGVARYAHDVALGHGAQGAAGPERGGGGGGRLEPVVEAHLAGEGDGLRAAGEHGLGAEVYADPGDLPGVQLAAEPVGGLQDGHAARQGRWPGAGVRRRGRRSRRR